MSFQRERLRNDKSTIQSKATHIVTFKPFISQFSFSCDQEKNFGTVDDTIGVRFFHIFLKLEKYPDSEETYDLANESNG